MTTSFVTSQGTRYTCDLERCCAWPAQEGEDVARGLGHYVEGFLPGRTYKVRQAGDEYREVWTFLSSLSCAE